LRVHTTNDKPEAPKSRRSPRLRGWYS